MIRLALALILLATPAMADPSAFGCKFTATASDLPAIEGRNGMFFRVQSDLRMQHPVEEAVVAQMGRLSAALAERGTRLIYLLVPTKGMAMPQYLPPEAADYLFDPDVARALYLDDIARLTAAGVTAPDMLTTLSDAPPDAPPFFQTDFHWTAAGARTTARALGAVIAADPFAADLPRATFTTTQGPPGETFSSMRRTLQAFCRDQLPRVEALTQITTKTDAPANLVADIFASDEQAVQIVLVGTSFSDAPLGNFAGYLSEFSGLDVVNYAVTGGNQFGAITSYLTSRDFAETAPRFLIWENPIYNNLAQYGPDAMEELITAASNGCTIALTTTSPTPTTLRADLTGLSLAEADSLLADAGADGARAAEFRFETASGLIRTALVQRTDRMLASGRFFKPLATLWHPDFTRLTVTFDRELGQSATLSLCSAQKAPQ
jgi:alginate biosynthesis protein AlgX